MKIWGMSVAELSALVGVIGVLVGWIALLLKQGYKALKNNIVEPLVEALEGLEAQLKADRDWIHERHSNVVKRLDEHDELLDEHDRELARHDERLRTLCEDRKKGYRT